MIVRSLSPRHRPARRRVRGRIGARPATTSIATPVLRANVTVSGDLVRIGDVIDNAGPAAQIAIYRAPDLGTTGTLPVDAGADRAARASGDRRRHPRPQGDFGHAAGAHARGQGHRARRRPRAGAPERPRRRRQSQLTFDRDAGDVRLDAANTGAMQPAIGPLRRAQRPLRRHASRYRNDSGAAPAKLRFTGTAIETVEAAVLARGVERNEVLKSSDVVIERRPKAEVGNDAAAPRPRGRHAGAPAAARRPGAADRRSRQARSGAARPERHADLPGAPGSISPFAARRWRAAPKATSSTCMNLQSKRTMSGVVTGRGQVSITVATPRLPPTHRRDLLAIGAAPRRGRRRQRQFARRLQKPSNVHVRFPYPPHHPDRRAAGDRGALPAAVRRSTGCRRSAKSRS